MNDIVALEVAERDAWADLYRAASPDVISACGVSLADVADAVLFVADRIDVLALNRLVGLGLHGAVGDAPLTDVLNAFERTGFGALLSVPLHPSVTPEVWNYCWKWRTPALQQLDASSPQADTGEDFPPPPDHLRLRQIDNGDSDAFGRIVADAFDYPPAIAPLAAQPIGRPDWYHYLAYEGDIPIAAAAMYVAGEAAWFGFEATEAAFRRRGAAGPGHPPTA